MTLAGIFILGAIIGAIVYRAYINTQYTNSKLKATYLKKHISKLEENAKQKRKKASNKSKRRYTKKSGSSRSVKGTSEA